MRKFLTFFSRFHKNRQDPLKPRTMEESQLEDLHNQKSDSPEEKRFVEKNFEKGKEKLPLRESSATH